MTSVCEVNSLPGSGGCGQNNVKTGFLTSYTYSPLGNLLTVAQNGQTGAIGGTQSRTYSYDGLSRLTSETNPESGTTQYFWDAAPSACGSGGWSTPGDIGAKLNNAVVYNCYGYDGLHRLQGVASAGVSENCRGFYYDSPHGTPPNGITVQNTMGRMVEAYTNSACNGIASLVTDEWFSYDADGRPTDHYQSSPNSSGYYHVAENYWANGAVDALNFLNSSGTDLIPTQTYGVDGEGRTNSVTASSGQSPVTGVSYVTTNGTGEPVGALTGITFGSLDSDTYQYDPKTGRMTQYSLNVDGQSDIGKLQWNLNGTLQQLAITDPFSSSASSQTCTYAYDALSRITGNSCATGVFAQTFSYDAFGNISKSGSAAWLPTYNSPINNKYLTGWDNVTYDNNGDLTQDPYNTYTWDVYGDLASANGQAITYDALGRMVENDNGAYQFVYGPSGTQVLAKMTGQTLFHVYEPLPGGAVAVYGTGPSLVQYNHGDWLGSGRVYSTPTRTAFPTMAYAPFGEGYDGSSGWIQFTGVTGSSWTVVDGNNDAGSLDDFMYRRYSPTQGRWISPDPAGLGAVDPTNPQSWNRYAYVLNNPLSNIDPLGLDCVILEGDSAWDARKAGSSTVIGDCPGRDPDNEFYFDGTVDQGNKPFMDSNGNEVAIVNGQLKCAGDSGCAMYGNITSVTVSASFMPVSLYPPSMFSATPATPATTGMTIAPHKPPSPQLVQQAIQIECIQESQNANNGSGAPTPAVDGYFNSGAAGNANRVLNQQLNSQWPQPEPTSFVSMNPEGTKDAELAETIGLPPEYFVYAAKQNCLHNLGIR